MDEAKNRAALYRHQTQKKVVLICICKQAVAKSLVKY